MGVGRLPRVIIHNSVSLDGSLTNFEADLGIHYKIAAGYKPGAHLIGSNTVREGVKMYGGQVPEEEGKDFRKPERSPKLPYWVIIDGKGSLKGMLHTCRRFEYCRDVIVIGCGATPPGYLDHLRERGYEYHSVGDERVDIEGALGLVRSQYGVKRVLTDTGRILVNLLLERGLASEVSLLVHPVIVGEKAYPIFSGMRASPALRLLKEKAFPGGLVWLVYRVVTDGEGKTTVRFGDGEKGKRPPEGDGEKGAAYKR